MAVTVFMGKLTISMGHVPVRYVKLLEGGKAWAKGDRSQQCDRFSLAQKSVTSPNSWFPEIQLADFGALTSRRSSIASSHPILKGHRSASVVLMDTCGRYDSHSRTEDMLREFRFKWSGRDTGQVKVNCTSAFFAVKPCRNEAKLRHCWLFRVYWRPWPPEHVEAATKSYSRPLRNVPSFGQKATCEDAPHRECAH